MIATIKPELRKVDCLTSELKFENKLILRPAAEIEKIITKYERINFIYWCYLNAIYQFPTQELVDYLKLKIYKYNNSSIEIGSGNNNLHEFLGIRGTDNYCQQIDKVKRYYAMLGQKTTNPNLNLVEKIDGLDAVKKYTPNLTIGSWVTHRYTEACRIGNSYGVREELLIKLSNYLIIGNEDSHSIKPILNLKPKIEKYDWLISRAANQEKNCIYFWAQQN